MSYGGFFAGVSPGPSTSAANTAAGLPFGGIPSELRDAVALLTAEEPEWVLHDVPFTHRVEDTRPLKFRRLFEHHVASVALVVALVVLETVSLQAGPLLTQIGIDKGMVPHDLGVVLAAGFGYIVLVGLTAVTSGARVAQTGRVGQRVLRELRVRVFAHQQRLSLDFYTKEKAGVIMTRMTSDIETLNQLFQDGFVNLLIQGLTMALVTAVLFWMNVQLAIVTIGAVVPLLILLTLWFRSESATGYLRVRDGIAFVLSDLQESLSGFRVVTAYNRQIHNLIHHRNVVGDYRDANVYTARVNSIYGASSDALGLFGQAIVLAVGGSMLIHHELTLGELTAFVLYLTAFFAPIQALVTFYNTYQQGQAAIFKLRTLFATTPGVPEADDAEDLPSVRGRIEFEAVSFGYEPGQLAIHELDLTIEAGETLALVGATGSGKSTIAKLVARFYDPTGGRITIDGHDLRDLTIASLRRQLGVIPQEPFLFAGTLRSNITFARPDATDAEVKACVEAVGLTELVERHPDGVDALVHERGTSLSAGERQLVALARTFLAEPRIVILDEATSNLDARSETQIEQALQRLLEGRTTLLIAHRLTTALRADRIGVIANGRLVEIGPHAELVARGGAYASLFATWSRHIGGSEDGIPSII